MSGSKAQYGEGSVFQVSDNKWVAKISMGTRPDGKPKVKQFSGKTEAIVKRKLRDFKKSEDYVQSHVPSKITVKNYFSIWLKEYQYNRLKPLSYDRLESTITNHIYPNIGQMKMEQVSRDQIQTFINRLYYQEHLSYSSVKKVYVALHACYKHAFIADVVNKNPCLGVALPSQNERKTEVKPLTEFEIERLKSTLSETKSTGEPVCLYGAAYLLILNTGLRMGEALSLRWSDVNFENKTITISKNHILTKSRDASGATSGGYILQTQNSTKTASGNRIVPMNDSAEKALRTLQEKNTTPYVIVNSKQKVILPSNFERTFHNILKRAGIRSVGVHALRHTFASMLFSKGVDVKIVSKLLGHSSVKITYDIYVHLFEKDVCHITNVLD